MFAVDASRFGQRVAVAICRQRRVAAARDASTHLSEQVILDAHRSPFDGILMDLETRIRWWLQEEWRVRKPEKPPLVLSRRDLNLVVPSVPALRNSCDSGIFLLRYAQEFLARAAGDAPTICITERDVASNLSEHKMRAWFGTGDIARMRVELRVLAQTLADEAMLAEGTDPRYV